LRVSHPSLLAAGRAMAEMRDAMVAQWAARLGERMTAAPTIPRSTVERQLRLLVGTLAEMVGPLRRETREIWFQGCEFYGRMGTARGLAAGEVVDARTDQFALGIVLWELLTMRRLFKRDTEVMTLASG